MFGVIDYERCFSLKVQEGWETDNNHLRKKGKKLIYWLALENLHVSYNGLCKTSVTVTSWWLSYPSEISMYITISCVSVCVLVDSTATLFQFLSPRES